MQVCSGDWSEWMEYVYGYCGREIKLFYGG